VLVLEIMNIDAAIRMLGNYVNLLEGARKMVLHSGQTNADPEIAAHIEKLQENFKKLLREATIDVIVLRQEMAKQIPVLLNFPAELAKLLNSLTAFDVEVKESGKAILQIDPTYFDPEPDKSEKAANDP
jgi:hypothetical protein